MEMSDSIIKLGTMETLTIQDHSAADFNVGQYTMDVNVEENFLRASSDKPAFIKHQISSYLAHCIQETTVPSHLWFFTPEPVVLKNIPSFPQVLLFGV
jgi:hypothetical protein